MHYKIEITITDLEGNASRSFERTVQFDKGRLSFVPHDPAPIDVDQKRRILKAALDEAAADAIKDYPVGRDKPARPSKFTDEQAAFISANRMTI